MLSILIRNVGTGATEVADYDYVVRVNNRTIDQGRIEGHRRSAGWQALVSRIADAHPESRSISRRIALQTAGPRQKSKSKLVEP